MSDYYPRPDQPAAGGAGQPAGVPPTVPQAAGTPAAAYPPPGYQPPTNQPPTNQPPSGPFPPHQAQPGEPGYQVWSPTNYGQQAGGPNYGPGPFYGNPDTGSHQTTWLPPVTGAAPGFQPPGTPTYPAPRRSTAWKVGVSAVAAGSLFAAALTGFGAGVLIAGDPTSDSSVRITGDGLPQLPGQDQGGTGTQTLPQPQDQPSTGSDGSTGTLPDGSDSNGDTDGWVIPGLPQIPGLPGQDDGSGTGPGSPGAQEERLSATAQAAADKVTPSVVNIDVNIGYGAGAGAGTGIVLTADGKVLTNAHVTSGASQIKGTVVGNNKTYSITVLGYDKTHDVALVQLEGASGLTPATVANADNIKVGDLVVGVGNAGGDGGAPTSVAGKVTETGATITASDAAGGDSETLHNLIGTDANIQSGQSGGPMVDSTGAVIGMNTAASLGGAFTGAGQSTGFAIPINDALDIANQIDAGKSSDTIHIGPTAFLGVQVGNATSDGVAIAGVITGSAADKAGLAKGDTIVAVDGSRISTPESLSAKIRAHKAGDEVTVEYLDSSGAKKSIKVTLGSGPAA